MIRKTQLQNFRSFRNATIRFGDSKLTIIIGANGSGKSNLIKCLEFVGNVAREGLEPALYATGGIDALLPKAIPHAELMEATVRIRYEIMVEASMWYSKDAPPLDAWHEIELGIDRLGAARVVDETLSFADPLRMQEYFYRPGAAQSRTEREWPRSRITIHRGKSGKLRLKSDPPFNDGNARAYLAWFEMEMLADQPGSRKAEDIERLLTGFLQLVRTHRPSGTEQETLGLRSLVEPGVQSPLLFAPPLREFRDWAAGMRRYDLQLSELRREQQATVSDSLSREGRGMPAVIRRLQHALDNEHAWDRVQATLRVLAPHIVGTSVAPMRGGKELIEFLESRAGRPVESWESSDGTLRALAILLAVESHPHNRTILIEEPEQGLHPWAVRSLMDHIRAVIRTRGLQVVLTTHSQQVLDMAAPEEVLVATRSDEGGTQLRSLKELYPSYNVEIGEVGRLWVAGMLGGIPGED